VVEHAEQRPTCVAAVRTRFRHGYAKLALHGAGLAPRRTTRLGARAGAGDQPFIATRRVAGDLSICPALAAQAAGNIVRIDAPARTWRLAVVSTERAHAVGQPRAGLAPPVVTRRLAWASTRDAQAVLRSQAGSASKVAEDLLVASALPAQSLGEIEAGLAAVVALRLTVAAADVAQAVAEIETGIAAPRAGRPAFDAAGVAGAARAEYLLVKFAL
jgi:hypothetical protein